MVGGGSGRGWCERLDGGGAGRGVQAEAAVPVLVADPGKIPGGARRAPLDGAEPSGNPGRIFGALNCACESGLSLDACGQESDW